MYKYVCKDFINMSVCTFVVVHVYLFMLKSHLIL